MVLAWSIPVSFEQPQWLWLCLLLAPLAAISWRTLAALGPARRLLSVAIRCLLLLVLVACLAGVVKVRRNDNLTVMFVLDRSSSVPDDKQLSQEDYIIAAGKHAPKNDRTGVIDFARQAFVEQLPMHGGVIPQQLPRMPHPDRTDMAAGMRLAMAMFPHDTAKRIVLVSDGNENMGDLMAEARAAQADGVTIDVVPVWYHHGNEVYFEKMIAPANAHEGEQVPVRMMLESRRATSGTISLYHNGRPIELATEYAHVQLKPGSNSFRFMMPIQGNGPQRFEARFTPDNPKDDLIVENNVATAFSFVSGKSKALILSKDPQYDRVLLDALASEKVDAELREVDTFAFDLAELLSYSAIVLSNVPASSFTDEQQRLLVTYVKDSGGGLIMTGGDDGFGAGGWIGSPVEEVMPVTFDIKHRRIIPRGALVVINHSCEIERGQFWGKKVTEKAVETIASRDYFGVVAYSFSPGGEDWVVPLEPALNKAGIKQKVAAMSIGDMPDFDTAMQIVLQGLLALTDASQRHVIIVSDGDPNPPSAGLLQKYVDNKITVSTVGIGYGVHVVEQTLNQIATTTGGRFHACRDPQKLPQIFVKESKVVRRPLLYEETFRPVMEYSLSDLLAGISPGEQLPTLDGMVLTSAKSGAEVPLVRNTKEGNDPVLAHWQYELGKTVAFTSGYWHKWGQRWAGWSKFAKLWAQIVRYCMLQESSANYEVFTTLEGNMGRTVIEALDEKSSFLNFLQFKGSVIRPDQEVRPLLFTQTGPGRYEATFEVDQTGQYLATAFEGGDSTRRVRTGLSMPFSPEFRELKTNEALLRQVQEITGGRWLDMNPETDAVFSHKNLPVVASKQPIWEWTLAWLLLPIFLLDVAARRLASWLAFSICVEVALVVFLLFGLKLIYTSVLGVAGVLVLGELVGWAIRYRYIKPTLDSLTYLVTVSRRVGERSTAALDQLKVKREEVREQRTARGMPTRRVADSTEYAANPKAKFDVGDKAAEKMTLGDIGEKLGGAKPGSTFDEARRPPAPASKQDAASREDMTSRLLRAKKRAREQIEDIEDKRDSKGGKDNKDKKGDS